MLESGECITGANERSADRRRLVSGNHGTLVCDLGIPRRRRVHLGLLVDLMRFYVIRGILRAGLA